ncbi:5,6-dimethylbenzimidazole synthase [Breoghania sp. L-A4]|uniref:5,6-dimethylbenzimidazole synthase n=1 Tax=Breoghania sp. L-A4 TaxID=2304600 RepID=UPI000E35E4E8|nr:5,6-dimethylbenzimidazole synthase [Breoghania sp. L-A4]AXS41459.1 5,6-dimethylbenzimidazole synthase [Breoghania sp. L-A4]
MAGDAPIVPPDFDAAFQRRFEDLLLWRRDVRRFLEAPVEDALLDRLKAMADIAPSVGNSQPWRFVDVRAPAARQAVIDSFSRSNAQAAEGYRGAKAALYASLKLEGLRQAPVHLAVFCDETTEQGAGLGRQSMPEMLRYSTVGAIQTLWLAARAYGLGVGWVSILEPREVSRALDAPASWTLVAYLCLGWPREEHIDPELERHGWQARTPSQARFVTR